MWQDPECVGIFVSVWVDRNCRAPLFNVNLIHEIVCPLVLER